MINLLPVGEKKQILAGRTNVLLQKYIFVSLILLGLLGSIAATFYVMMVRMKSDAQKQMEVNSAKIARYQSTQKEISEFKNNLSVAKAILGKEIHYSKIIPKMASTFPANTILKELELNNETISAQMSLRAGVKNWSDVIPLKTSMENSDVFQNVHFESVSYKEEQGSKYPIEIIINVTLKPEVIKL